MRKFLFIGLLFLSLHITAKDYEEIVEVLKYVETLNQPHLIGDNGDSFGVLQVQKGAVEDVNRYYGTDYKHEDMFQVECAEEVTTLYMKMGADLYRKKYNKEATVEVLVRNHNGGIYRGHRVRATIKYYKTYLKWSARLKERELLTIKL